MPPSHNTRQVDPKKHMHGIEMRPKDGDPQEERASMGGDPHEGRESIHRWRVNVPRKEYPTRHILMS